MTARQRLLSLAACVAAVALVVVAGCGGGDEKDARALLRRAFAEPIPSANVTIDALAKVEGVPTLSQPIRLKLSGPFVSGGAGQLPNLNWDVSVSGGGQSLSSGLALVAAGGRAYVSFQGTNYEIDESTTTSIARTLSAFAVDPNKWIKHASEKGDSTEAGVPTRHVAADLDASKLYQDIINAVGRLRGLTGVSQLRLPRKTVESVNKVVHDASLDVFVGKRDSKIRKAVLALRFDIPKEDQARLRGLKGTQLSISVELAGVGEPQTITPPPHARPISDLWSQLKGLGGALGAAGGIGGSNGSTPGGTPGGAPGTEGGGGKSPSQSQFQRYAECLNKAKPSDTAALNRCSDLLK